MRILLIALLAAISYAQTDDVLVCDSNHCLENAGEWDGHTCASANFADHCEGWSRDMHRCCPITCGVVRSLSEAECNALSGSGSCLYPNSAQSCGSTPGRCAWEITPLYGRMSGGESTCESIELLADCQALCVQSEACESIHFHTTREEDKCCVNSCKIRSEGCEFDDSDPDYNYYECIVTHNVDCKVRQAVASDCTNCGTVIINEVERAQSGYGAPCVGTSYNCQPGDGACPEDIDCRVRQAGPADCTSDCGTVTVKEVEITKSGNGAECVDTTYECQPGDGECPRARLASIVNIYDCDNYPEDNEEMGWGEAFGERFRVICPSHISRDRIFEDRTYIEKILVRFLKKRFCLMLTKYSTKRLQNIFYISMIGCLLLKHRFLRTREKKCGQLT